MVCEKGDERAHSASLELSDSESELIEITDEGLFGFPSSFTFTAGSFGVGGICVIHQSLKNDFGGASSEKINPMNR